MEILFIIIGVIVAMMLLFLFCAFFIAQKDDLLMEQLEMEECKLFNEKKIETIKERYKKGMVVELLRMNDPYRPVPSGTKGIIDFVDDSGTIFVNWENGSTLGLVIGEDQFKIISTIDVEKENISI